MRILHYLGRRPDTQGEGDRTLPAVDFTAQHKVQLLTEPAGQRFDLEGPRARVREP